MEKSEANRLHRQGQEFLKAVERKIEEHKRKWMQEDGFIANPSLPIWKNVQNILLEEDAEENFFRPTNMACHDLTQYNNPPGPQNSFWVLD